MRVLYDLDGNFSTGTIDGGDGLLYERSEGFKPLLFDSMDYADLPKPVEIAKQFVPEPGFAKGEFSEPHMNFGHVVFQIWLVATDNHHEGDYTGLNWDNLTLLAPPSAIDTVYNYVDAGVFPLANAVNCNLSINSAGLLEKNVCFDCNCACVSTKAYQTWLGDGVCDNTGGSVNVLGTPLCRNL